MKPVGIERDREIARLRGDCVWLALETPDGEGRDPFRAGNIIEPYFKSVCNCGRTIRGMEGYYAIHHQDKDLKPYSTDIVYAFQLWEEMKGAGLELILTTYKNGTARCLFDGTMLSSCLGETEADAISGCYLKWKGEGA